jgi:hypothetical protein
MNSARPAALQVPIAGGETVTVWARLAFSADGALLRVLVPPPAGRLDPREGAARLVLEQIDAWLRRPGAPGMTQIAREAEALAAMAEHLVDIEAQRGPSPARQVGAA